MAPANHWIVPQLASWWHDQPHRYSDNGGSVDDIWNDTEHWGYSLAFIASCIATVAVAVIIWDILIRLIGSCCCSCLCSKSRRNGYDGIYGEDEQKRGGYCSSEGWMGNPAKPGHKCRWSFAAVLIILAIAAFIPGIIASFNLKNNVDDMVAIARDVDNYRSEMVGNGGQLLSIVDVTLVTVDSIRRQSRDQPDIVNECNTATSALQTARAQAKQIFIVNETNIPYLDDVSDAAHQIPGSHIGMAAMFIITSLFLLGITKRGDLASKPCSYSFCQIISVFFFFITWLCIAIYAGIAMGLADGCIDPYALGHKAAHDYLSDENARIVDYYATCIGTNPLQTRADTATEFLGDAADSVVKLRTYATIQKPSLLPLVNQLDGHVKSANTSVHSMITLLNCARLTNNVKSALDTTCGDKGIVGNFTQLVLYIGIAQLFFVIARWFLPVCNCCRRRAQRDQQPLLDAAAQVEGHPSGVTPPSQNPYGVVVVSNNGGAYGGYAAPVAPHIPVVRATPMVYVQPRYESTHNTNSAYVQLSSDNATKRGSQTGW